MTRVPYEPDDDQAADRFLNSQIRRPDPKVWAELFSDRYVEQTWRILHYFEDQTVVALGKRRTDIETLRRRRAQGTTTRDDYLAAAEEYEEWKTRTLHFQALVRRYCRQAYVAVSRIQNQDMITALRAAVKNLTLAIAEHRDKSAANDYEPTDFDRLLWARLGTTWVPGKSPTHLLSAAEYLRVEP
jgi:hypothetical protein